MFKIGDRVEASGDKIGKGIGTIVALDADRNVAKVKWATRQLPRDEPEYSNERLDKLRALVN